eukprot:TRINITY_DN15092_c0_g1::TRINITY_DN15092_c0_g1_i1::g.25001::m.25001 TRINITY_DN15092_c0_g1::TRINITY_DN15092_c0_g1_i1::g.25001  ORF type:complete len:494 (-),score=40.27,sp/B6H233/ECM14_PENRW/27.33/5e-22,Peptidase_M14/PF00246.19/3.2e-39 TRINITY_DN15092_c0_g1_i1:119-1600(-)
MKSTQRTVIAVGLFVLFSVFLLTISFRSSSTTFEETHLRRAGRDKEHPAHAKISSPFRDSGVASDHLDVQKSGALEKIMAQPHGDALVPPHVHQNVLPHAAHGQNDKKPFPETGFLSLVLISGRTTSVHDLTHFHIRLNNGFLSYALYETHLATLASIMPDVLTFQIIGKSVENRAIPLVRFSLSKNPSKEIFMMGGQHGREWQSPLAIMFALHQLIFDYQKENPAWNDLLAANPDIMNYAFTFVPIVNPDGYCISSRGKDWRYNSQHEHTCLGVDLNRNWDTHWEKSETCGGYRHGTRPFSAPETNAVRRYLESRRAAGVQFLGSFDTHCCSSEKSVVSWYSPFAWTCDKKIENYEAHALVGKALTHAANVSTADYPQLTSPEGLPPRDSENGRGHFHGFLCQSLNLNAVSPKAGSSVDYFYEQIGVDFPMAVELRVMGMNTRECAPFRMFLQDHADAHITQEIRDLVNYVLCSGEEYYAAFRALATSVGRF